jgi:hypothetical protein
MNDQTMRSADALDDNDDRLSSIERVLRFLRNRFDNFTYDPDKDPRFFLYLFEEFPGLDIEEELKQFHAWTLDQDEMRPIYYRYHFRRWLKRRSRPRRRENASC